MCDILLYTAYGEIYRNQAIHSIVTLYNLYKGTKPPFEVKVFTDHPASFSKIFKGYPVEAIPVSDAMLREWSGPDNFIHRRKIKAIEHIQQLYKCNTFYVDTDTIFFRRIDKFFEHMHKGDFYLHTREWPLSYARKLHPAFLPEDLEATLPSGSHFSINGESVMWNAGVVGIPYVHTGLLNTVTELCDFLYRRNSHPLMEQFAFSVVLQQHGNLLACKKAIYHYWRQKVIANQYIDALFRDINSLSDLVPKVRRGGLYFVLLSDTLSYKVSRIPYWGMRFIKTISFTNG